MAVIFGCAIGSEQIVQHLSTALSRLQAFTWENSDEALRQILKLQLLFQNKKKRRSWVLTGSESLKNHQENVYLVQGPGVGVIPKSTRDNLGKQLVESGESDKW